MKFFKKTVPLFFAVFIILLPVNAASTPKNREATCPALCKTVLTASDKTAADGQAEAVNAGADPSAQTDTENDTAAYKDRIAGVLIGVILAAAVISLILFLLPRKRPRG